MINVMIMVLDFTALISILIFTIFILKLWQLVKHKSLFVFMLTGAVGLILRVLLLSVSFGIYTASQINLARTIMANVVWILLAIGAALLYLEVKNLLHKRKLS